LRIDRVQEIHDILHDMFMIDNCLLNSYQLLQQHGMVYAKFIVLLLELLQLLLGCNELVAEHVHLLRRHHHLVGGGVGFPGRRRLPSDVVERIFVVRLEVGMFEFPRLPCVSSCLLDAHCYTHACTIWRLPVLLIVVSHFVEIVLVQLSDERGEITVLEVLRQDMLGKLLILGAPVSIDPALRS